MNRYKLVKAGIDPNEGLNRFSNNAEMYEKFLYEFPNDTHFQEMLTAIDNNDPSNAFKAAHALKGVTGNLSIKKLYESLLPLVEEFRAGSMEKVPELLPEIKDNYESVTAALKELAAAK